MEEKTNSIYPQVGDTYKAMLLKVRLQAHPQSTLYSLASYQICTYVLKNEELHEYNKLDKVRCSSNKAIVISGPIAFISFMAAGLIGNVYVAIIPALAGIICLVAAIKANRAEKQIKLIEDMARAKFEKDWDGTTGLDRLGGE